MFAHFIVRNGEITKKALQEYEKIDRLNECELLEWVLKYQDVGAIFNDELRKSDDWEKNYLVIHKEESIILDCSNYRSSFKFEEIYNKHYDDLKITIDKLR